jgi:hypothetical protein
VIVSKGLHALHQVVRFGVEELNRAHKFALKLCDSLTLERKSHITLKWATSELKTILGIDRRHKISDRHMHFSRKNTHTQHPKTPPLKMADAQVGCAHPKHPESLQCAYGHTF